MYKISVRDVSAYLTFTVEKGGSVYVAEVAATISGFQHTHERGFFPNFSVYTTGITRHEPTDMANAYGKCEFVQTGWCIAQVETPYKAIQSVGEVRNTLLAEFKRAIGELTFGQQSELEDATSEFIIATYSLETEKVKAKMRWMNNA